MKRKLWMLTLLGLAACVSSGRPPDANRMRPRQAPTPFSAAQIREACPDGTWIKFTETKTGISEMTTVLRFLNGGPEEVTVVTALFDAQGRPMGEPFANRKKWTDLQAHASFPEDWTRIRARTFDTFRGKLEGWLYIVDESSREQNILTRYSFARDLPGPPVLLESYDNGELVRRMTMVGRGTD